MLFVVQFYDGVRHPHSAGLSDTGGNAVGDVHAAHAAEGHLPGRAGFCAVILCGQSLL